MRDEFSAKTKDEAFVRANGNCEYCHLPLSGGRPEYHHILECAFGGTNSLANCLVVHKSCHKILTKKGAKVIAKSDRQRRASDGTKALTHKLQSRGFKKTDKSPRIEKKPVPDRRPLALACTK